MGAVLLGKTRRFQTIGRDLCLSALGLGETDPTITPPRAV
jgi:hypothetical protein